MDVERQARPSTRLSPVLRWTALVVLLLTVWLVRATVVVPVRVDSASMEPTFPSGAAVLVSRRPPDVADLERGDVVVFRAPDDGLRTLKRVVGVGGDVLVVRDGVLFVDDEPAPEPYVDHAMIDGYYSETFTVPEGSVFVLGDNRGNSVDSRDYGPVSGSDLLGRVLFTIWPLSR